MFATNRLLKYINIVIGLLLLGVLGAAFWFVWRPMPQTSGTIQAPISAEGTISRDRLGVPHLNAANEDDLLFLQGYVTAQDRFWQMDAMRRQAAGDLAEIVGPAAVESDRTSRRLRLWRIAREQVDRLSPPDRAVLSAYARGVNQYLITHQNKLPLEFRLLDYHPRPWTISDSILVGLQMLRTLTTSWDEEIQRQTLLNAGAPEKVRALYPLRTGLEEQPGSNAWVVSGRHTASGKPLLANDMHLEFRMPATWYMVHLQSPELHVAGLSLPGLPGVIVGHNERIAWGITNLHFDVQDLYIEKLDTKTGAYIYRGQTEQARLEHELIPVKGAKPVEMRQWITRHGPVFFTFENQYIALRWIADAGDAFQYPFVQLNKAHDWTSFQQALARMHGPGSNLVYADVEGNIGYQVAGKLPIRRAHSGASPVDSGSGAYEWEEFIPFSRLPSSYNPPSGILATANQNPFPEDYPYPVNGYFAPGHRFRQIQNLLRAKGRFERPEDMLQIQMDVYSGFSHFLAGELVKAHERKRQGADMGSAVEMLRQWNGQMENGQGAPMIAILTFNQLRRMLAESVAPGAAQGYGERPARAALERLLRERPEGWFEDWDAALLEALAAGLEEGRRIQGANLGRWDYGRLNELRITHPVGGRIPLLYPLFNVGPVRMSGAGDTVKQISAAGVGPSQRFVADLSAWDRSLLNITTGQSGHVLSSNYKDQWSAYTTGRSYPMAFERLRVVDVLIVRPGRSTGN